VCCDSVLFVVPEKKNSDIIDRLMEKRQKDHNEAVSQLQTDLASLSEVKMSIYCIYHQNMWSFEPNLNVVH